MKELKVGDVLVRQSQRVEVIGILGRVIFLGFRNAAGSLLSFPPFMPIEQVAAEGWIKVDPDVTLN